MYVGQVCLGPGKVWKDPAGLSASEMLSEEGRGALLHFRVSVNFSFVEKRNGVAPTPSELAAAVLNAPVTHVPKDTRRCRQLLRETTPALEGSHRTQTRGPGHGLVPRDATPRSQTAISSSGHAKKEKRQRERKGPP